MATRERVIFNLDRFEWTGPGWLQVWGGWDGMDRRDLAQPALVVHANGRTQRVSPPPDGIRGGIRNWHAIFPWEDDPAAIESAELEFAGNLVIELPAPRANAGRRRFGRTRLAAREVDAPQGSAAVPQEPQPAAANGRTLEAAMPPLPSPIPEDGPGPDADPIEVHVAVVAAREQAAEAREELKLARAATSRAVEDAEGERTRRQSEAARLHEALDTLRDLAEEELRKERESSQGLAAQIASFESLQQEERALAEELRGQLQALSGELVDTRERAEASRAEAERLQGRVGEVEREARTAVEARQGELDGLQADLAESRQVAESWGIEAARMQAELEEARREAQDNEQLRTHLAQAERVAHQAGGEVERLRARLDEAQERAEGADVQVAELQGRFEASRAQAEQADASAESLRGELGRSAEQFQAEGDALRAELEATQRRVLEAENEADRLRRSLAAVREALQQT